MPIHCRFDPYRMYRHQNLSDTLSDSTPPLTVLYWTAQEKLRGVSTTKKLPIHVPIQRPHETRFRNSSPLSFASRAAPAVGGLKNAKRKEGSGMWDLRGKIRAERKTNLPFRRICGGIAKTAVPRRHGLRLTSVFFYGLLLTPAHRASSVPRLNSDTRHVFLTPHTFVPYGRSQKQRPADQTGPRKKPVVSRYDSTVSSGDVGQILRANSYSWRCIAPFPDQLARIQVRRHFFENVWSVFFSFQSNQHVYRRTANST